MVNNGDRWSARGGRLWWVVNSGGRWSRVVRSGGRWWLVVTGGGWWWLVVVGSSGDRWRQVVRDW